MFPAAVQNLINAQFRDKLEIITFCANEPTLEIVKNCVLEPGLQISHRRHLEQLQVTGKPNEMHVLVDSYRSSLNQDLHLQLESLDFASICTLREINALPAVLSASAILFCRETEELILHQRAASLATHPGCLHIFGGAFNPDTDIVAGLPNLGMTIRRELFEETGLQLNLPKQSPMLLTKEKTSGFIQFCVLGIPVPVGQLALLQNNWEGEIRRVAFADLPEVLLEANWVASGKAHVLSWLALGAAMTAAGQKFASYTPEQLFETILRQHRQATATH
jgi:8-oxo-dGTP pyrophosphatase MutT (NUDIX family)